MSKKAVTRAWLDLKSRFAETQADAIYSLVSALVEQRIKEALVAINEEKATQKCSTLCHPYEPCTITFDGKCAHKLNVP